MSSESPITTAQWNRECVVCGHKWNDGDRQDADCPACGDKRNAQIKTTITVPPLPDGWEKWDRGPFVADAHEECEYRRIDSGGGAQTFTRTRNYSLQQVLFALNLLDAAMPSVEDQTP